MFATSLVRLRAAHVILVLGAIVLGSAGAGAGELEIRTSLFPRLVLIGQTLTPRFVLHNRNPIYPLGAVFSTVSIRRNGGAVVYDGADTTNVGAAMTIEVAYDQTWTPTAVGSYTAIIAANSVANISGVQRDTIPIEVGANTPCPEEPIFASGGRLYLGAGSSSGSISIGAGGVSCCYEITTTIVTGKDAVTIEGGTSRRTISGSSPVSIGVSVDRARVGRGELLIRFNWRACDGSARGTHYMTILLSDPPGPDVSTTPPPPGSTAGTPLAASTADPVNAATGELYSAPMPVLSIDLHPTLPVELTLGFASDLPASAIPSSGFGDYWTHRYAYHLVKGPNEMIVHSPAGRQYRFASRGNGYRLDWPTDHPYRLELRGANWAFYDPAAREIWRFDTASRRVRSVEDIHGYRLAIAYPDPLTTRITNPYGRALTLSRDTMGRVTSAQGAGRTATFRYGGGRLTHIINAAGDTTRFEYAPHPTRSGLLRRIVLPNGNAHYSNEYDTTGRVIAQTDALGNRTTISYTGTTTRLTTPSGAVTTYVHDARAQLTTMTDALDGTLAVTTDANGRRTGLTDRLGHERSMTYGAAGSPTLRRFTDGSTIARSDTTVLRDGFPVVLPAHLAHSGGASLYLRYDSAARLVRYTDMAGDAWAFSYDANGRTASTTSPLGVTRFAYTSSGDLESILSPRGRTTYSYDAAGRRISTTHPDMTVEAYAYDPVGRIVGITRPGLTVARSYDRNGNLLESTIGGETLRYRYDAMDRLVAVRDADDAVVNQWGWNADGQLTSSTSPAGTRSFSYNANGWRTEVGEASGARRTSEYDAEGGVSAVTGPGNIRMTVGRDAMGRPLGLLSDQTVLFGTSYDALGRISTSTNRGVTASHAYEGMRSSSITIPTMGITGRYERGAGGLLASIVDPIGGQWDLGRDSVGRVTRVTMPNGATIRYTFAAGGTRMTIDPPGSDPNILRINEWNRMALIAGSDSIYAHRRDTSIVGTRVRLVVQPGGQISRSNNILIGYDEAGRMSSLLHDSLPQLAVDYRYDASGLVSEVEDAGGRVTRFGYDADGRRTSMTRPNATAVRYGYDEFGEIDDIDDGPIGRLTLVRDSLGRVESIMRVLHPEPRTVEDRSWTYNGASQVIGDTYDSLGYATRVRGWRIMWDAFKRLQSIETDSVSIPFEFDAFGNATAIGGARFLVNYAYPQPRPDVIATGGTSMFIVREPDGTPLYAVDADGSVTYFSLDHEERVIAIANEAADVQLRLAYSPTNEVVVMDSVGTVRSPVEYWIRYLQGYSDQTYDPFSGRRLSPAQLRSVDPLTLNPYASRWWEEDPEPTLPGPVDEESPQPSGATLLEQWDMMQSGGLTSEPAGDGFIFGTPPLGLGDFFGPLFLPDGATEAPRETPKSVKVQSPSPAPTIAGGTSAGGTSSGGTSVKAPTESTAPVGKQERTFETIFEMYRLATGTPLVLSFWRSDVREWTEWFLNLIDEAQDEELKRLGLDPATLLPAPEGPTEDPNAPESILEEIDEVTVIG